MILNKYKFINTTLAVTPEVLKYTSYTIRLSTMQIMMPIKVHRFIKLYIAAAALVPTTT